MKAEEIELVLAVIDKKAEEYKEFRSSHRRIMEVRSEVEEELNRQIHPPDDIQEFPKPAERIAAMIKEADEREMWG